MRPAVINIPTLIVSGLRHDCSPRGAAERGPGPAPRSRATRGPPTTSISKRIRGAVLARQPDHDCIMITNRLLTERLYLGGCRVSVSVSRRSHLRRARMQDVVFRAREESTVRVQGPGTTTGRLPLVACWRGLGRLCTHCAV